MDNLVNIVNTDPFLLFFGTFYIVLGLSCVFAQQQWEEFIALFVKHDSLSLFLGVIVLPISLFIVFFYNNWDTIGATVLMVLGYMGLVKAVLLLMRPRIFQNLLNKEFVQQRLWLDAVSGLVLGGIMLFL